MNDWESGVICRYKVRGVIVDVMPTSEEILGFSNRWYSKGFANSKTYDISPVRTVRIFSPEYFIATKLEAFKGRGKSDGRSSTDFEDIVYVLNNRTKIWDEMKATDQDLKRYFEEEFGELIQNKYLTEWIGCHLEYRQQDRVGFIISKIRALITTG